MQGFKSGNFRMGFGKRNNKYFIPFYTNELEKREPFKFDEYMNGINQDGKLQRFSLGFGR